MSQETLLIRADASVPMGTGHVMRCLALAQAWQDAGGKVVFAAAELLPFLHERLLSERIDVVAVEARAGTHDDARRVAALAQRLDASWVVVDGYHFHADYQRSIKETELKLLFVDDAGNAGPYCADIVLNQNLHAAESMYDQREPYTSLLLGAPYILLRRDFTASRGPERPMNSVARRLLVSMGGSDPDNITAKVVEMLRDLELPGWKAIAVLAQSSAHLATLTDAIRSAALPVQLLQNVADMAKWMRWADLAITAGGTTIWELAFMGVPAVAMTRGEHERMLLQGASSQGIAIDVGPFQAVETQALSRVVASLAFDEARRLQMSRAGQAFVDGLGATRVVGSMRGKVLCN